MKSVLQLIAVLASAAAALLVGTAAQAHILGTGTGTFATGFGHPLGGLDHLLAMVAVGLWAAQLGRRAAWRLPLAFMAAMLLGGAAGFLKLAPSLVEIGIVASVIAFGAAVALRARLPLALGLGVVGGFALFHGYAHGAEAPAGGLTLPYAAGFVLATGLLHALGLGTGLVFGSRRIAATRAAGLAIAAVGVVLAAGF